MKLTLRIWNLGPKNTPQTTTKTGENKRFEVACEPLTGTPRMAYFGPYGTGF